MEKPLEEWNTTDFHNHIIKKTKEIYGLSYQPFGGWGAEKGMLGRFIGTKTKPGEVSKEVAYLFIEMMFEDYKPTPKYPIPSFGFYYTYKKWMITKAEMELKEYNDMKAEQEKEVDYSSLSNLL